MKDMKIKLLPCVRFKLIPIAFYPVIKVLSECGKAQNFTPLITGAAFEEYAKGGYHDRGYAWDIRISNVLDPLLFAVTLFTELKRIDKRYRLLYGDNKHTDHIHIEYRYDLDDNYFLRGK